MRIFYYPECNFNVNKARIYDVKDLPGWFDSMHANPDDYEIVGKDGKSHDSSYEADIVAVYPKIRGGKKGKNVLTAVVGLALILTGGGALAHALHLTGTMAKTLGAGLLLSGGGALIMGKMKMPSMDVDSSSATKQNYQWSVGNLSTSRGVKGVTFGSDVVPEGELLAYKTYGTNSIQKIVEKIYSGKYRTATKEEYDAADPRHKIGYFNYKKGVDYTYKVEKFTNTVKYTNEDSSSYLELLIGAGEGELDEITDIKINDIPLADLDMEENTDYAIRLGSNTQAALKQTNLDSQVGNSSIGQTVPQKLNDSVTPLLVTTPSACDSCEITFQTNAWYLYDTASGAKNNAYIKLKIGYRVSGSTGDYTYLTKTITEIDNKYPIKSDSAFYFKVAIKFPSNGAYQICIENDSAELNYTKGLLTQAEYQGSALPDRAALTLTCDSVACYDNKEQTYPGTALIWLRIPASQTLNGSVPKVTWKQSRSKIYAYNGSSYVEKDADNLAWAIYDILAQVKKDGNTYHNEGEDVANLDYSRFDAFATFCESIDATGNWFLSKLDTSWDTAMSVATSCRAFIGLRNGKAYPYWDAPAEMTQIFTVGNYENMSGVVTAKKDRAKAIEATFNNEEEDFKSRTVRVEIDNDHSAEAVSMTFVGLSTPESVSKASHYLLRRNKYLVQSIKFTANIDSLVCELNDVIGVQCDITEYGVGGRIFKVEGNKISLDAPVTLTAGNTYALLVRHSDGTLERNTPVETSGTYTQLNFAANSWTKAVEKGDIYSFGIANSEVRKFRVTGITRTSDLKATIEAVEYNPNVYDELAVEPYTYSNPNAGINSITTTYNPESVDIAWDANNNTAYVDVYIDGQYLGRYEKGATIPNINSTQELELVPVNENGESSASVVRAISNNLPTPSTPPAPVVQSTTTGCVAAFDGIPRNENIVWLIIKEGDTELGRVPIMGEYMTVSIQLTSGTHTLTAYFLNQYNKTSQGRTFTGVPLGDMVANDISASALKLPTGSILRLSAKNCTNSSILETNGVKDVSGTGHHGKATGSNVTVVHDAEMGDCFHFNNVTTSVIAIDSIGDTTNDKGYTVSLKIRHGKNDSNCWFISRRTKSDNSVLDWQLIFYNDEFKWNMWSTSNSGITPSNNPIYPAPIVGEVHTYGISVDKENKTAQCYYDGQPYGDLLELSDYPNTANTQVVIGGPWSQSGSNFACLCDISDVRIYPRALSASEIKTIYMFPDDATFGQLTADLIGANIIKGTNLFSENIITSAAQITQAVVNDLNVTGNATFQAGLNGIQVGGRNLIRNTSTEKTFDSGSTVGSKDYRISAYAASNVKSTDDLTISFEAKASEARWLDFYWNDGSSSYVTGFHANSQLSTSYQKFTYTLKSSHDLDSNYVLRFRQKASESSGASGGPTIYIKNLIVEMGTRATSWTPAPEDTDASIAASEASAKSYADTKMAISDFCEIEDNTTVINGGRIKTNSIAAAAVAAGAINVEKVTVGALSIPVDPNTILKAEYGMFSSGALVPNRGITNQAQYKLTGAFSSYESTATGLGYMWRRTSKAASSIAYDAAKSGTSTRTIGTSYTLSMIVNFSDYSAQPVLMDAMESASSNNNRVTIYLNTSRQIKVDVYNASGTKTTITLGTLASSGWQRVTVVLDNGTWRSFVSRYDATSTADVTSSSDVTQAHSSLAAALHAFGNLATGATADRGFIGYIGHIYCYGRALTDTDHIMLCKNGGKNEVGTITTQMLATDAIKGRSASGGGDGSYTTSGLVMNLSGAGWMSAKNFYIDSSGNASFKGEVTAESGKIGELTINSKGAMSRDVTTGWGSSDPAVGFEMNLSGSNLKGCKMTVSSTAVGYRAKVNGSSYGFVADLNGAGSATTYGYSFQKTSDATSGNNFGIYGFSGRAHNAEGWSGTCDSKMKRDIKDVSTLDKLKTIEIKKYKYSQKALNEKAWKYEQTLKAEENLKKGIKTEEEPMPEFKDDENAPDYIMAMAGEFNKAFGVDNGNEESINYTNAIGVALRSIQELAEIVDSQKAEIEELKAFLKNQGALPDSGKPLPDYNEITDTEPVSDSGKPLPDETQQDEKSEAEPIEPTSSKTEQVENTDSEPSFEELLKDGENQQEEQK